MNDQFQIKTNLFDYYAITLFQIRAKRRLRAGCISPNKEQTRFQGFSL